MYHNPLRIISPRNDLTKKKAILMQTAIHQNGETSPGSPTSRINNKDLPAKQIQSDVTKAMNVSNNTSQQNGDTVRSFVPPIQFNRLPFYYYCPKERENFKNFSELVTRFDSINRTNRQCGYVFAFLAVVGFVVFLIIMK
eukprot:TCONS_00006806-protein